MEFIVQHLVDKFGFLTYLVIMICGRSSSCTGATIGAIGSSSVTNKTGGTPLAKVIVPPNKA